MSEEKKGDEQLSGVSRCRKEEMFASMMRRGGRDDM